MRLLARFSWWIPTHLRSTNEACKRLVQDLEYNSVKEYPSDTLYDVRCYTDQEEYRQLRRFLSECGLNPAEMWERVFSKEEVSSAELLIVFPLSYASQTSPEESGTVIERVMMCKKCKLASRRQLSPLRLRNVTMKNTDIAKSLGDDIYIVTSRLAALMRQLGVSDSELKEVEVSGRRGKDQKIFQLVPAWHLPPLDPSTLFIEDPKGVCPACGLLGRVPMLFRFKRSQLVPIRDVGLSFFAHSMNYQAGMVFTISRRLHEIMQAHKIKGYRVEPIEIVED